MRAVNLMPRDARTASGSAASWGSGAGVYVLLAGLAALVAFAAMWAIANKQIGERQATLARVGAEATAAEARAGAAAPYVTFAKLASDRVQTVTTLSSTRFDWAHAMHEVSRVLPADVWLSGFSGSSGAAGDAPTPTTSGAPAPTISLVGCTRSQAKVARLLVRLRTIDGVRTIALKSSEKPDGAGDQSCPANRAADPNFTIAISFAVPGAPADGVDDTGRVTAPVPAAPAGPAGSPAAAAVAPGGTGSPTAAAAPVSTGKDS
jgi:Tfp pilus assembly protein PilN